MRHERRGVVFAAVMVMLVGGWPLVQGLAALVQTHPLVVTPTQYDEAGTAARAWLRLTLGAVIVASGYCLRSGSGRARGAGVGLAAASALAALFYLPPGPWWAVLTVALDVYVLSALVIAPTD